MKNQKRRGVRYNAGVGMKSSSMSARIDSYTLIMSSGLISIKNVLQYVIPGVTKNKIFLGGKFKDRSTKAYKKYDVNR